MNAELAPQQVGVGNAIVPRTMTELIEFSKYLSQSEIVPDTFRGKPANIFVAIQWGMEIGLLPFQALQSIAIIHGRPMLYGDAGLALVYGSSMVESFEEEIGAESATCRAKRKGNPKECVRTFTKADAEKAGLWGKNTWAAYPKRMLQMRARWWALRDTFPDVLRGVSGAEDHLDVEIDVTPVKPAGVEQPQSVSSPAKPGVVDAEIVTPTPAPAADASPSSSDPPATPPPTPTAPANQANAAGEGKPMGEGQVRIIRARLASAALSDADLMTKFGTVEDLKFGQFQEVCDWIAERAKSTVGARG